MGEKHWSPVANKSGVDWKRVVKNLNKAKDLVHELALKQQSIQSQLQSTRETMDRMASQVQRSKERMGVTQCAN